MAKSPRANHFLERARNYMPDYMLIAHNLATYCSDFCVAFFLTVTISLLFTKSFKSQFPDPGSPENAVYKKYLHTKWSNNLASFCTQFLNTPKALLLKSLREMPERSNLLKLFSRTLIGECRNVQSPPWYQLKMYKISFLNISLIRRVCIPRS